MSENLSIASNPDNVSEVERYVDNIRETQGLSDELYGNILICLTEAVNNGIYHGNEANPSKNVEVRYEIKPKSIVFQVSDEGEGFDFSNLPDPTDPENLSKLTGRGVFLMKQLSDLLVYSNGGSTVEMEFKL